MRIFLFFLPLFGFTAVLAQSADFRIYESQNNVMLDVTLKIETTNWIASQDQYGGELIATPFQISNYLNEHMSCKLNNQPIQFTIESSVSNKSKVIVTFSSDQEIQLNDVLTFSTDAFTTEFIDWKNNILIDIDQQIDQTLTKENQLLTYKYEDK